MRTIDELAISQTPWKCDAGGSPIDANNDYLDPTESEAILIAAAPDMYKALYDIVEYIDNNSTGDDNLALFVAPIAEKALAKASGEEIE